MSSKLPGYLSLSKLETCFLTEPTSNGLFLCTGAEEKAVPFWVVGFGNTVAISLGGESIRPFTALYPRLGDRNWFGVHTGEVELVLDPSAFSADERFTPGWVSIEKGKAHVLCHNSGAEMRARPVYVGDVTEGAESTPKICCGRWALVQIDADGERQAVFRFDDLNTPA
jgi:hypothetical protein